MPPKASTLLSVLLLTASACSSGGGGSGSGGDDGGAPPPGPSGPLPLGVSAGTGNAGAVFSAQGVSGPGPDGFSNDPMPALSPSILTCIQVGGAGDQYAKAATISASGLITVTCTGDIVVEIIGDTGNASVTGDLSAVDASAPTDRPSLPGAPPGLSVTDARHGLTYQCGYRQVAGDLQQPWTTISDGGGVKHTLWNWSASAAKDRSLTADSRCYRIFPMPDGNIGVTLWCDGGNSTLSRDPRSLAASNPATPGSWQGGPNSMSTCFMLVNPISGAPISGTFLRNHVTFQAVDRWGRVYLPRAIGKILPTVNPENPFGHSASASTGLFVLAPDLKQKLYNVRLGGTPASGGRQAFNVVVIRDHLLVLAGSSSATDLAQVNPTQTSAGGGQDIFIVVLRLWSLPSV